MTPSHCVAISALWGGVVNICVVGCCLKANWEFLCGVVCAAISDSFVRIDLLFFCVKCCKYGFFL